MRWVPRDYQARAVEFGCANEICAYLLDMGLGKTVCTLTVIADEVDRCVSPGICIVAPPKVVDEVWGQEAAKWDHLKGLKVVKVRGNERSRTDILTHGGADVYLVSYSNLLWLAEWMLQNQPPFDGMVFDESSMMKCHSTKRFKRIKPFMPFMRRRMILTGTPAAESLANLWSQYYLLDQGERLGKYITHFKLEHFRQSPYNRFKEDLIKGQDKIIYKKVEDITMTLRAEDHLKMTAPVYNEIKLTLPEKLMDKYKQFEKEMFVEMGENSVEALNAASLSMKCRQFTSGAMYDESSWYKIHDIKIDALKEVIEQQDGQPLLVAYEFRHEAERFKKLWPKAPIIGGGSKPKEVSKAFALWNKGKIPVMFVQPQSVGHGVNLQYGGHHLLWYSTTWSGERYQQTVARLHRQGQSHPVTVSHLVVRSTVDPLVVAAQRRKGKSQDSMMSALAEYRKRALHSK